MRITNVRDLKNIPLVDEVDMYFSRTTKVQETQNECVAKAQAKEREAKWKAQAAARAKARAQEKVRDRVSYAKEQELKKSILPSMPQALGILQSKNQTQKPVNRNSFGVCDALQTWLPGEVCDLRNADFTNKMVIPASHFDNIVSDMHLRQQKWPADYPLVKNDKQGGKGADFRGVIVTAEGSADFSEMIVDQARTDFGRTQNRGETNSQKLRRYRR